MPTPAEFTSNAFTNVREETAIDQADQIQRALVDSTNGPEVTIVRQGTTIADTRSLPASPTIAAEVKHGDEVVVVRNSGGYIVTQRVARRPLVIGHPNFFPSGDPRGGIAEGDTDWHAFIDRCDVLGLQIDAFDTASGSFQTDVCGYLASTGKGLAVELAGLQAGLVASPPDITGLGADSAAADLLILDAMTAAGKAPDYLRCDDPIARMIGYTSPVIGASITDAINELVAYMQAIHQRYPAVKIGLIIGLFNWGWNGNPNYFAPNNPSFPPSTPPVDFDVWFPDLVTACNAALEHLSFVHIDPPITVRDQLNTGYAGYQYEDWWERLRLMRNLAGSLDVDFGIVFGSIRGMNDSTEVWTQDIVDERAEVYRRMVCEQAVYETFGPFPLTLAPQLPIMDALASPSFVDSQIPRSPQMFEIVSFDIQYNTSAADNIIYAATLGPRRMLSSSLLHVMLTGTYLNNTGAPQTVTVTFRFGGSPNWKDTSGNIAASATRYVWTLEAWVANRAAMDVQVIWGRFTMSPGPATTGLGDAAALPVIDTLFHATATVDCTVEQFVVISWQHSASNALLEVLKEYGLLEIT